MHSVHHKAKHIHAHTHTKLNENSLSTTKTKIIRCIIAISIFNTVYYYSMFNYLPTIFFFSFYYCKFYFYRNILFRYLFTFFLILLLTVFPLFPSLFFYLSHSRPPFLSLHIEVLFFVGILDFLCSLQSKWNASLRLGVAQRSVFPFLIIYIKYQTKIKTVCYAAVLLLLLAGALLGSGLSHFPIQ